ncbi:MAG TPA: aminodeoxychorismate lyase [Aquificaceae bacterium]|nr:aminodeoxychorismate lyase [Aquificaceae bacterium]HIQ30863.1 aminodeoxychorismate lyase [Aquifex aeolicus]
MNRTLYFGEGLFETIRWRGEGEKVRLHYERLSRSAEELHLPYPSYEEFLGYIRTATGGRKDVYVKFLLLPKGSERYQDLPDDYEVRVVVKDLPPAPGRVKLTLSPYRRHSLNPLHRHKTTSFLFNVLVKREAMKRGYWDAIVLNERGEITECSASNLLLLKGDRLLTPVRESGLLWGTTLELLSRGFAIEEERLTLGDLAEARAIFVINSLIGVVPVMEVYGLRKGTDEELLKAMNEFVESC